MNIDEAIAWIGSVAGQAHARDSDDGACRVDAPSPDEGFNAAEIRAMRLEHLERAVRAGRLSRQQADEIRAELRSGSARAEVRDNPGSLRFLRDGEPMPVTSDGAFERFKLLSREEQQQVLDEIRDRWPDLAAQLPGAKAKHRESPKQEKTKPAPPAWLTAPTPTRAAPVVPSSPPRKPLTPEERSHLERYYAEQTLVERHEAGHAVMAHALGLPVQGIDIGHSGHFGATSLARGLDGERALLVLFAGIRAELSHRCWDDELKALWPDQDDMERANEFIINLDLTRDVEATLRTSILDRVDDLLSRNFRKVDALAAALVKHKKLDREQVEAILGVTLERD